MSANVLIVDDSLTVRMDLADAFDAAGFRPLPCASLEQAREVMSRERIDVAILDVILPDGDGVELLREIRSAPSTGSASVLMLSTETEIQDRIRGLETGADEYVGKPYDSRYVIARIRQLLNATKPQCDETRPILVIDDSATTCAELTRALESTGHRVVTAKDGETGLQAAASERPAAVVVDGVMPGIDGATVIRRIRLDAALRGIPCILLTAAMDAETELRALDSGADAFVHKGEDSTVLLAKLSAALRSAQEEDPKGATTSLLGPKKVLAVDDSATYREELANALREDGYDVIQAKTGEEAIELLSVQQVDCVLLDLVMPGIGGTETCRRLKASTVARDIPVVMLTAVEDRESMLEGLAAGADDYIQKSTEFGVLKARVRAQLRRRQFEDETRRVREQLLRTQMEAAEARAARQLFETRAALVEELERKNEVIENALRELQETQAQLVQSAKMASLGQLVSGVAHEINNPLSFVMSHIDTVHKCLERVREGLGADTAEVHRESWERAANRLDAMTMGLTRIQELVVKLRTFSRLDEGEQKMVRLSECVESVLTILGHRLKDGLAVETRFEEPDYLDCFPSLLNQAIMNLVANAIDAVEGEGMIRITTHQDDSDFVITVADTGRGIPEALRQRVLEPFFTTKPAGAGTGLGLSITYSIVQKHGGNLELRSHEGGGTEAVMRIPTGPSTGE